MDALDNIINAVTEIILVFEEALKSEDTDVKIEGRNLDAMVQSITKMIDDQRKLLPDIDDANLKGKMAQTFTDVLAATSRLAGNVRSQNGGIIPKSLYQVIHDELKSILQNMIIQIQIIDQVNVRILMVSAKKNLDCVARMNKAEHVEGLNAIVKEYSKLSDSLQLNLKIRVAETTNADIRQRLVNAIWQPIVQTACQNAIQLPSPDTKSQKDKALKMVVEGLQEIVTAILMSAKYIGDFTLQFAMPTVEARPRGSSFIEPATKSESDQMRNPRVEAELSRLENAVRNNDDKDAVNAAKNLASEVTKQVDLARDFAVKIKDEKVKQDLLKDAAALEQITPKIIQATKDALNDKSNTSLKDKVYDLVNEARDINQRINDARKLEKQLLENSKILESSLKRMYDAALSGNKEEATKLAREVTDRLKQQVALARSLADQVKDPANKEKINAAADELERLIPALVSALKEVLEKPGDKEAQKRLKEVMIKIADQNSIIAKALLEDQLAQNNSILKNKLDQLNSAVQRQDAQKSADLLKDIIDLANRRTELGKKLANEVKDPQLRSQILNASDKLESQVPQLAAATKSALQFPNDEQASQRLEKIIEEMKSTSDRITANKKYEDSVDYDKRNKTADEIINNSKTLEQALSKLADAIRRGDAKAAAQAAKDVSAMLQQQVNLGRKLAEQCQDPVLRKKILDACEELERLIPLIVQATKDALLNPNDKAAKEKLDRLMQQARDANKIITDAAEELHTKRKKEIKAEEDKNQRSEYRADGSRDEIMVAAHTVSNALKTAEAVIPEHKNLLEIAKAVAAEMELLSIAAQNNSKKDMIASARKIAGMISKIQSFATEIARKCTDAKLREQLLSVCKVPNNFAVQLKIISAVKESTKDDPSAEAQLVVCAQGLANSVVQTVKATEAAAIKCPR